MSDDPIRLTKTCLACGVLLSIEDHPCIFGAIKPIVQDLQRQLEDAHDWQALADLAERDILIGTVRELYYAADAAGLSLIVKSGRLIISRPKPEPKRR